MSSNTIYLITGASRGIGKGLVAAYLARPNATVIAAVRKAADPNSKSLETLRKGAGSQLLIVEIDATDEAAPAAAVQTLQEKHGIDHLDVVIANAGVATDFSTVAQLDMGVLKSHVAVNGFGAILLFQAVLPLLEKSSAAPKFVALGTPMSSMGAMETRPFPMGAYGASKVITHWAMRKAHFEHPNITVFPVDPGWVQTDMGNGGAQHFGMKEATTSIQDSINYLTSTIDTATKEKTSGHFPTIEGGDFAW